MTSYSQTLPGVRQRDQNAPVSPMPFPRLIQVLQKGKLKKVLQLRKEAVLKRGVLRRAKRRRQLGRRRVTYWRTATTLTLCFLHNTTSSLLFIFSLHHKISHCVLTLAVADTPWSILVFFQAAFPVLMATHSGDLAIVYREGSVWLKHSDTGSHKRIGWGKSTRSLKLLNRWG